MERETTTVGFEAEDLAYWRDRLTGAPLRTDLPTIERREAGSSVVATHTFEVPESTARRVREVGASHAATPFVTLLAAFDVLLYRYTGQTDLVVGSPNAHRHREIDPLVGSFANSVVLRTQLDPNESFANLLARVRQTTLEAFEHQSLSFERIVAEVPLVRAGLESALVNVRFRMDDERSSSPGLGDSTIDPSALEPIANVDLSLSVGHLDGRTSCTFAYPSARFERDFIARMAGNFRTLLASIVARPDAAIARLALLCDDERHRLLVDFNSTDAAYAPDVTLRDLLEDQARLTPSAIALEWEDGEGRSSTLDFAELHRRADSLAKRLEELGVGPNVGTAIALDRSPDLVIALLAVIKAGGYYVPLDPAYPSDRLRFMLDDSRVPVLVTHARIAPSFARFAGHVVLVDDDATTTARGSPVRREALANDLAYMIYTSGSTGRPKGALNRHAGIVNRLQWMKERFPTTAEDVVLQKTSFSFDVSVWELLWPLSSGSRSLLARPGGEREPAYLVDLIVRRNVSFVHFVPSMLRLFLDTEGVERCRSIRHVINSGEELPADLVAAFFARSRAELHNLYGPTETAIEVTHFTVPRDFSRPTVPIGRPLANTRAYVLDATGQPVPIGVRGELHIGGVQVGAGYLNAPELTARKFVPDPFCDDPLARLYRTGDIASYTYDGTIEYRGRADTQVKINGVRIELGEIESVIRRDTAVRDAAVIIRGERAETRLLAYIVSDDTSRSPDDWRQLLAGELPSYMLPRVVLVARLPLTPNGKLDYAALPEPDRRRTVSSDPRKHMLHHELIAMWESSLGFAPVEIDDDYFTLGGDSLRAVRLVAEMSRAFDHTIATSQFLAKPTIAAVAAMLLEQSTEFLTSPLVALRASGSKTPFFYIDGDLHGGGYYVRGLARRLDDDRPLYALHMPGTQGRPVPPSIEAAARELYDHIARVRPHGPYALGGFCAGGLIAFEIARLLQAKGELVEDVIVLETYGSNAKLAPVADTLDSFLRRMRFDRGSRRIMRSLVGRGAHQAERIARKLQDFAVHPSRTIGDLVRRTARERPEIENDGVVEAAYLRLTIDYIPRRFRGALTVLLIDGDSPDVASYRSPWRHVAGGVRYGRLAGSHLGSITRHIDETATTIDRNLSVRSDPPEAYGPDFVR